MIEEGRLQKSLAGKKLLLCVSGGIAAYKSISLVSLLAKSGVDVHVALTESAQQFVTPLPFQSLSKNPVITSMFDEPNPGEIAHIALADTADLVVIAPATANVIAKAAHGIADDFMTTALLATKSPVLFVPAMNVNMWNHPSVQQNLAKLRDFGYLVMSPASGQLACGWVGEGRLPEPDVIYQEISKLLAGTDQQDLSGIKVLVTAGATREHFDPVRVLTNPASGKMGFAIAEAAKSRGAEVTLIAGPTSIQPPEGVELVPVVSAVQMHEEVLRCLPEQNVLVMAAAVSDWRPKVYVPQKVKKVEGPMMVEFVRNPDILLSVAKQRTESQVIVGFAAETESVVEFAMEKLQRKKLDLIVANDVSRKEIGFESDSNQVYLIHRSGAVRELALQSKRQTADAILIEVAGLLAERSGNA